MTASPTRLAPLKRDELIRRVHQRLMNRSAPRLELLLILTLSGAAAFLTSVLSLNAGLASMVVRYPLAVAAGYATFLVLIRLWIAWQRSSLDAADYLDAADLVSDLPLDVARASVRAPEAALFVGGRSGGAGGGASFGAPSSSGGGSSLPSIGNIDLDWDELWPLALAIVCVLGGLIAVFYVIYAAPILLAEVALDAAVLSALYRRLRREDASHWAMTVVRKTWIAALALVLFAAGTGYAMQRLAPEARSIGGVMRVLSE